MKWGLRTFDDGSWFESKSRATGSQIQITFDSREAKSWGSKKEAQQYAATRRINGFAPEKLPPTVTTPRAAPGKGKRNRLTDLRCAWRHASVAERAEFLAEVA